MHVMLNLALPLLGQQCSAFVANGNSYIES